MEKATIYSLPWDILTRASVTAETIKDISAVEQVTIFDSITTLDTAELAEVGDLAAPSDIRVLVEYKCSTKVSMVVQIHSDGRTISVGKRKYQLPLPYFRWVRSKLPSEHQAVLPEELTKEKVGKAWHGAKEKGVIDGGAGIGKRE